MRQPKKPGKILVVHRYGGLGDLLVSTCVPAALKRAWPDSSVDLLTSPRGVQLVEGNPHIRNARCFSADRREWRLLDQASELRRERYDAAVVLWSTAFDAWMLYLSGIPVRAGQGGRLLYSFLYTHRVTVRSERGDTQTHWTEIMLDYVRALGVEPGAPEVAYHIDEGSRSEARKLLTGKGWAPGAPLVGFHLGKGLPVESLDWPVDAFIGYGQAIVDAIPCTLLLTGSSSEAPLVARVKEALGERAIDCSGATTTRLLAALIAHCSAFVCPDSFPMHLAGAIGIPTAGIFALKSDFPMRWRPFGTRYLIVAPAERQCGRECVKESCRDFACYRSVSPGAVADAVKELMAGGGIPG